MKRKISVFFLAILLTICLAFTKQIKWNKAFAEESYSSKACYLIDWSTKTEVIKHNERVHRPIASMCKIMTLLLSFDKLSKGEITPDEQVIVSENASKMGGSQVFLEKNGIYEVSDLLKSIIVASANDASVAMAEHIYGTETEFVSKMNEKCNELNMNDTVFVNCTGLPAPDQYSCAKDVATMLCELLKHKSYFDYSSIWMDEISHSNNRVTQISNTNKLIRFYDGCDGGKTGYTCEAGHCLAATAKRNNTRLVSVVLGAPNSKTRFKETSSLFDYGFANFTTKKLVDNETALDYYANIKGAKDSKSSLIAQKPIYIFSKKNEKRNFEYNFILDKNLKAPLKKGDKVGILEVYENGVLLDSTKVLANQEINSKTYLDCLFECIKNFSLI